MHICYVSYEYPPQFGGGIGTYVANISANLAQAGNNITVITINAGDLPEFEKINGVNVHRVKISQAQQEAIDQVTPSSLSTLLYWSLYSEKVYRKLKEISEQISFDAVEFPDYRGEGYYSILAKRVRGEFKNIPFIVRLHTPLFVLNKYNEDQNDPGLQQLEEFEKFCLYMCDHLVSPSEILANITESELHINNIAVLPHPIDISSFSSELTYKENSEEILYVGRLEKRKGVEDLVKALVIFFGNYPNAQAKFIGGDTQTGPNNTSMKAHLDSIIPLYLKNRFTFIDRVPREEVIKEYRNSRFCVFPSKFENFPNVCLEAMASSVPVLVSNYSGMSEMIEDGKSGFIFKAGDVKQLIYKLEEIYKMSGEERKSIALEARKRVESAYTNNIINKLQMDYFNHIKPKETNQYRQYEKGLVSVIIPCFNHGDFIEETILSVQQNSYKNIEIIVVNDGSTDPKTLETLERIKKSGIIVIDQPNAGLSAARNKGINQAKGEYILPLDADDLIDATFLEKTVLMIQSDSSIGFVYTHVEFFGAASGVWQTPEFDPNLLLVSNLCVASTLFRHIAFDQIGGYRLDMTYGFEDWDFWIYMVEHGWKGKCIAEPLFKYRKHEESMLTNSQRHRSFLIQKIVEHHKETFEKSLEYVLIEKDKQFFEEHMSNFRNYKELYSITNSKFYKLYKVYNKIKRRLLR